MQIKLDQELFHNSLAAFQGSSENYLSNLIVRIFLRLQYHQY